MAEPKVIWRSNNDRDLKKNSLWLNFAQRTPHYCAPETHAVTCFVFHFLWERGKKETENIQTSIRAVYEKVNSIIHLFILYGTGKAWSWAEASPLVPSSSRWANWATFGFSNRSHSSACSDWFRNPGTDCSFLLDSEITLPVGLEGNPEFYSKLLHSHFHSSSGY